MTFSQCRFFVLDTRIHIRSIWFFFTLFVAFNYQVKLTLAHKWIRDTMRQTRSDWITWIWIEIYFWMKKKWRRVSLTFLTWTFLLIDKRKQLSSWIVSGILSAWNFNVILYSWLLNGILSSWIFNGILLAASNCFPTRSFTLLFSRFSVARKCILMSILFERESRDFHFLTD